MSEQLPTTPDALAAQLVQGLRMAYPGTVEEWERQRTEALASGEDGWPDFQTVDGALWWPDSEVTIAEGFIEGDETARERAIACTTAGTPLDSPHKRI
jgi:hypothetical protein